MVSQKTTRDESTTCFSIGMVVCESGQVMIYNFLLTVHTVAETTFCFTFDPDTKEGDNLVSIFFRVEL